MVAGWHTDSLLHAVPSASVAAAHCPHASGLRSDTSIVVETAQAFSTHHAAMLIGYGAHALCPYLAYETARQWRLSSRTQSLVKSGKVGGVGKSSLACCHCWTQCSTPQHRMLQRLAHDQTNNCPSLLLL